MILNLIGQINIFKTMNIKPNFSELSRIYGIDRRTIKKYYEGYEGKSKTRNKSSKLDKDLKTSKKIKGYPRFETPPGKQAQVDCKEDLKLISKNNEEFIINVFNYRLGNSRYLHFEYRKTRTQQENLHLIKIEPYWNKYKN